MAAFVIMIGAIWQDALATEELFHGRLLSLFIYDGGQDVSCPSPVSESLFPYPKTLQYLMGHSDISVTMNSYTHLGLEDTVEEMRRMQDVENARKEQEKLNGKTDEVKISKNQFRAG